jgi:MerR family gold-responsive transcriptional activator of gol and ges genes
MKIGEAAHAAGISAKMIRYYEAIGLIHTAKRRPSGYRQYEAPDVHRLRVIRIARDSGFSLASIREILALWDDRKKSGAQIKVLAQAKIVELETLLRDIDAMIHTLRRLATTNKHRSGSTSMADARVSSRAASRPRRKGR